MKFLIRIFVVTWVLAFGMTEGGAAKTYKIGAFPIPLMVEDQDHGVFVELFKEVARRTGENFELEVYPTNRTLKLFQDGQLDGFFPGLDLTAGEKSAKSSIFYRKSDFIFVREGTSFIYAIARLEGKKVGLTTGYPYSEELTSHPKITFEYADSDVINMSKLSKGRIDAFVVEEKSGLKALKESGATNIVYNPEKPLSEMRVFFAFQGNEEGQALADKFSKAIAEMEKDGTFEKIMRKAQ